MTKSRSMLAQYLDSYQSGGLGWRGGYEVDVAGHLPFDQKYSYLSGHYARMLDTLIALVGVHRVEALIDANRAIDVHCDALQEEAKKNSVGAATAEEESSDT